VGLERGPLSLVRINEDILERKVVALGKKLRLTAEGIRRADRATPFYPQNSAQLRRQRRSLSRYSSLADYRPQSSFLCSNGLVL
jgi:hypothetical protein